MSDTLGDRIKRYEKVSSPKLLPKSPLFIRIDGKAFHTFTKGFEKPFSQLVIDTMVYAAQNTAKEMSGFALAYVQSDEATFMLTDYSSFETQGWFDYELNKVVSISASAFTAYFNRKWDSQVSFDINDEKYVPNLKAPALFDSRAFTVPLEDAPNVFIWRQRDWERNSVQMLARAYFSHAECQSKNNGELHEMLYQKNGWHWAELNAQLKNGTFILKDGTLNHDKHNYDTLKVLLDDGSNPSNTDLQ